MAGTCYQCKYLPLDSNRGRGPTKVVRVIECRPGASTLSVPPPDGLDSEIANCGVPAPRLSQVRGSVCMWRGTLRTVAADHCGDGPATTFVVDAAVYAPCGAVWTRCSRTR